MICDLVFQHITLVVIAYTGFLRFATNKENLYFTIIMSHLFEFAAHTAPLMIIQFYNNGSQNSFSKPADIIVKMNLAFSILNVIDLVLELILT